MKGGVDNQEHRGVASDFKYTSSRCTTHLEMRYVRRAGSIYSVLLVVDQKPVLRIEPNACGQLAQWLRSNADMLDGENQSNNADGFSTPVEEMSR